MTSLFNPVAGIVRKHAARLGVLEPKMTALYNNSAANVPWEVLYQTPQVSVIAPPGTMLYEEILDLAQLGQVLDQQVNNPDAVLTLMDGAVRRATRPTRTPVQDNYEPRPPGTPVGDLSLPQDALWVGCSPLMDAGVDYLAAPARPLTGEGRALLVGTMGIETGGHDPVNRCRYVRLWVMRGSHVFTPEEEITFASYKVHINWTAPNSVVAEWTYPIPATKGAVMEDRIFDLRDYGADGGVERFCFIMEFRRNGQLIQLAHNQTWEGLTSFDVPTYPVRFGIRGWVDTSTKDYDYDGNNGPVFAQGMESYGEPALVLTDDVGGRRPWGGAVVLRKVSQCTNEGRTLVWMKIWRDTDDTAEGAEPRDGNGLATYTPAPGASPIPIPPGAQDGCTLHVKLLRATRVQEQMYPFQHDGSKPNPWAHAARLDVLEPKVTTLHDNPGPLFYEGGGPELALPDPSLPQWVGRFVRYVRTNGDIEVRFNMDGSAWLTDAIQSWKVANAAARLALVPTAVDVHRVCRQLDDNSAWLCVGYAPAVWRQIDFPAEDFVSNRAGAWKHGVIIADFSAPIPATPGAVLFDEEINVGPWGCIAHTQRNLLPTVSIQKPDGSGGWIGTIGALDRAPPWVTGTDPEGYDVEFSFTTVMATPYGETIPPPLNGGLRAVDSDTGGDVDSYYEDRRSRIRLIARRSSRVYSPAEQLVIDAYGYRARITLLTSDLVLWEREFPLEVVPSNQFLFDELLDLAEFGLTAGVDRSVFIMEFRRNGKTIRPYLSREYQVGETFDHPAPPVRFDIRNISPNLPRWVTQNGNAGTGNLIYYGDSIPLDSIPVDGGSVYHSGVLVGQKLGSCSEALMQHPQVAAWREGDLPTTYWDGSRTGVVTLDLSTVTVGVSGTLFCTTLDTVVNVSFVGDGGDVQYLGTTLFQQCWSVLDPAGGVVVHFTPGITTVDSALSRLMLERAIPYLADFVGVGFKDTKVRFGGPFPVNGWSTLMVAGDAFGPVQISGGSLVSVPVVPSSFEGCTVRIRLLAAPQHRYGEYPFTNNGSEDLRPMNIKFRTVQFPTEWEGLTSEGGRLYFEGQAVATTGSNDVRAFIRLRAPNGVVYDVRVANDGSINTVEN